VSKTLVLELKLLSTLLFILLLRIAVDGLVAVSCCREVDEVEGVNLGIETP